VVQTVVDEIRVDLKPVDEAKKGEHISIKTEMLIRRSDKLYKMIDAKEAKQRR
jgi:putative protease